MSIGVGRHAAYDAVSAIRPLDAQEALDRENTLEWIASGAQVFRTAKPDVPAEHLVAYFALVDRGRALDAPGRSSDCRALAPDRRSRRARRGSRRPP